jgi:hypothetical protein
MEYGEIAEAILSSSLSYTDLKRLGHLIEGQLQNQHPGSAHHSGKPKIGKTYIIGESDVRNGAFKVRVLKHRQTKALVEIVEKIRSGSRPSTRRWGPGHEIIVPYSMFDLSKVVA